jgi:hypothetical protein
LFAVCEFNFLSGWGGVGRAPPPPPPPRRPHTHTHTHTLTHILPCVCAHNHACAHTHARPCMHARTCMHKPAPLRLRERLYAARLHTLAAAAGRLTPALRRATSASRWGTTCAASPTCPRTPQCSHAAHVCTGLACLRIRRETHQAAPAGPPSIYPPRPSGPAPVHRRRALVDCPSPALTQGWRPGLLAHGGIVCPRPRPRPGDPGPEAALASIRPPRRGGRLPALCVMPYPERLGRGFPSLSMLLELPLLIEQD